MLLFVGIFRLAHRMADVNVKYFKPFKYNAGDSSFFFESRIVNFITDVS